MDELHNENVETEVVEDSIEQVSAEQSQQETSDDSQTEKFEETVYTQADVDVLRAEIDDLKQYKPEEKSEAEIKLQEKAEILWNKQVSFEIEKNGLEVFSDFIRADVDDTDALQSQITKLKEIVGALELSNSYQPTNHMQVDAYSIAKKNRSPLDMISAKLNS
ncbi:xanthine phosphoribosyltransferase [Bacillus sp. ISL-4]|uniref:xanthine phosphoribosyltransferase n=1 Tax=Bacillus sp. ISL-4 TaxID=2819125 RepID=UPI001BE814B9|nr:xanthine phosphoribosyltransferase [Bacillus sp. ISL-4]MBT2667326.1 xanthine phosphoribosyltransferase [Bacillus sp. ISL-4]MBT2669438.1 hypothetical protein [Streptomyces sp. ISL-14]